MRTTVIMEQLFIILGALIFPPLLLLIALIVILASLGKSIGIRRTYVQYLLKIFEWGRNEIKEARRQALLYYAFDSEDSESTQSESEEGPNTFRPGRDTSLRSPHSTLGKLASVPIGETEDEKPGSETSKRPSTIIHREAKVRILNKLKNTVHVEEDLGGFGLTTNDDVFDFTKAGIEAIIEDDVTNRFEAEELACWNLLTRTSYGYQFANWRLGLLWLGGFLWRYLVLFPGRIILFAIGISWLILSTTFIGYIPHGRSKKFLNRHATLICFRILSRALSAIITCHNKENMAKPGGICVANHTSPIDVMILECSNCYALIGQKQGGLLGVVQRALNRATHHIWFERSEATDRAIVTKRLREHILDTEKLPVLIFPEGTCINNTSVMMFKKGSFEVGGKIYPAAIKYDPRFGDPFWNSSKQSYMEYIFMMMTSWAIVCDIWYLPPMERKEGEDSIGFANRVKRKIAKAGGLVDLDWDGGLKRAEVPEKMKERAKELYAKRLETLSVYDFQSTEDVNDKEKVTEEEESVMEGASTENGVTEKKEN